MRSGLVASITRGITGRVSRTDDTTFDALNWADSGWATPTAAGVMVGQASAMQVSAVFACVSLLSYDLAKLGADIFRGERHTGNRQRASDHFLAPLLNKPAPWLTWFEFCGMLEASLLLRGNGYAVILRKPDGLPCMLVPINPDRVALWEAQSGELFYMVTRSGLHELNILRNEPLLIPAEDIFHLKGLTMNGLLGLSPIGMAREAIGLAIAQEQLASRWAANSAKPSGVLYTDQKLSKEAAERLKENWKTLNTGLYNAGKTAVLEQGLKWQQLSMTMQDMEFIASRNFQLEEIARIYRVPMHMLGQVTRTAGNSVSQLAQEYLNYSLSTWIELWQQRIAFTFDLDPKQYFVAFDVNRLLKADIQTRYAANRIALGGVAWRTANEVRADEGEPAVEGGDVLFRPVNVAPISSDVFSAQPDPGDPTLDNDPDRPQEPKPGEPGSDQTGVKGEGGGRPPAKGIPKKP